MTTRHVLLSKSRVRALLDLSNPKKSVCLPLVKGKAAGQLELIYQLFPPRGVHRHQIAPIYTFTLEGWVTHELPIMVDTVAERYDGSDDLIFGFIGHDHWSDLREKTDMDVTDSQQLFVAAKCNTIIREGKIYLYKEAYAVIKASHKYELGNMREIKADKTPVFPQQTKGSKKPKRGEKRPPGPQKGNIARVLLAEDSESIREGMVRELKRAGYYVDSVGDGRQLIGKLKALGRRYDMVITDNDMPRVSGLEVLNYIRKGEAEWFKDMPVVVFSGSPEIKKIVEEMGGNFIEKGGNLHEVVEKIGQLLKEKGKKTS